MVIRQGEEVVFGRFCDIYFLILEGGIEEEGAETQETRKKRNVKKKKSCQ